MAAPWWKQHPYLSNLYGMGEAAATIGGGMLTQSGAGLAGLAGWLAGASPEERARIIEEAMQQSPYLMDPGSAEGQQIVQGLGYLMSPVQKAGDWLATASEQAGGGPLAMSIAKTIPDAALWGLGTPSMLRGGAAVSRGAEALTGRVADLAATGPGPYRVQSGARPAYGSPDAAPQPALLPGEREINPAQRTTPLGASYPSQRGAVGDLQPDTLPNPFYENLGTAIRNRPGAESLPPKGSQRPFYSVLYDAVNELPEKGTPQEMVSILKRKGVKQAEIDAFLLPELFSGQWLYDKEGRYFTESRSYQDPMTGEIAFDQDAPKFVTKQQIKDFISPSTETSQAGPASVFDVQQWRAGYPDSGIQKITTPQQKQEVESIAANLRVHFENKDKVIPKINDFAMGLTLKYPRSFFKNRFDPDSVYSSFGRLPLQQIGFASLIRAFSKEFPDEPLESANSLAMVDNTFKTMLDEIDSGEDYTGIGYANWVQKAEETYNRNSVRNAEDWFDNLSDEKKNFIASYWDAAEEASTIRPQLNELGDINDTIQNSFRRINDIQNTENSSSPYGMMQLLSGEQVDPSIRPGALPVDTTVLTTGLLIPREWSNAVRPDSYHGFPAGTVAFNRTTQRPIHLASDTSFLPQGVARLGEQIQSDINQAATSKYETGNLTPEGEREKKPIGYLMGRVPETFKTVGGNIVSRSTSQFADKNDYAEPGTAPFGVSFREPPVRLPFSETGQWSRLGVAQLFADAIEAGDDVVSISSPTQHMLAHSGSYVGSMAKDQNILYMPPDSDGSLGHFGKFSSTVDALNNLASKEVTQSAKTFTPDELTDHLRGWLAQNIEKGEKAPMPDYLRKDIEKAEKELAKQEKIKQDILDFHNSGELYYTAARPSEYYATARKAIKNSDRIIQSLKDDIKNFKEIAERRHVYNASPDLLFALENPIFIQNPDIERLVNRFSSRHDIDRTYFDNDFDYNVSGEIPAQIAWQIWQNNGGGLSAKEVAALSTMGLYDNVITLKAGNLQPKKGTSAAGLSTFYGKNLKSTFEKFAKEIDPEAKVEVGGIPSVYEGGGIDVPFNQQVYTIRVTDRMREQYRNKGFKLFTPAIAGGYLMEQTLRAEIENRRKAMLED
jgi:hypothetical protein